MNQLEPPDHTLEKGRERMKKKRRGGLDFAREEGFWVVRVFARGKVS